MTEAIEMAGMPAVEQIRKPLLHVDTGPKHLATLIELLKVMAVKPFEVAPAAVATPPAEGVDEAANAFEEFVLTQLEEAEGATLTVAEALAGYAGYCLDGGYPRYSPRQFHDRLPDSVKTAFGIEKSHDIIRDGHAKRGFRHLRLKGQAVATKVETLQTDRTARTILFDGLDLCHADLTAYLT
jgi:hypothetical protein